MAQDEKAKDAPAADKAKSDDKAVAEKDKAAPDKSDGTTTIQEGIVSMPRMQIIANVLTLVLLCLLYLQGIMVRSEIKELQEKLGKG
jgi:hypothetical protein